MPTAEESERYWTSRAQMLWEEIYRATEHIQGEALDQYIWTSASEALTARDAEGLCALFRLADARSDVATEVRFATAIRAMERRYYDCAYAAWDDAGRCWAEDEAPRNVPDSKTSANTMMVACDKLIGLETVHEQSLCDSMSKATV